MKLRKNQWYNLTMNGKVYTELYVGKCKHSGYKFISDDTGACMILGINRLVASSPSKVSKVAMRISKIN